MRWCMPVSNKTKNLQRLLWKVAWEAGTCHQLSLHALFFLYFWLVETWSVGFRTHWESFVNARENLCTSLPWRDICKPHSWWIVSGGDKCDPYPRREPHHPPVPNSPKNAHSVVRFNFCRSHKGTNILNSLGRKCKDFLIQKQLVGGTGLWARDQRSLELFPEKSHDTSYEWSHPQKTQLS